MKILQSQLLPMSQSQRLKRHSSAGFTWVNCYLLIAGCFPHTCAMKALYVFTVLLFALACTAQQQTEQPSATPMKVSAREALDHLESKVAPEYPEMGIANRIQNNERLRIVIDEKGQVADAKVESGHPAFAEPSLVAVKLWKYRPFLLNDAAVSVETTVVIAYRLDDLNPAPEPGPNTVVSVLVLPKPPGADDSRLRIKPGVMDEHRTKYVPPVYPQMARAAHIQGDVILNAVIDKQGSVASLRPVSGHPILIQSALDAVRQWAYEPYMLNGEPVEVESTIHVIFELPSAPKKP
jgi:TonB family protein